MASTSSSTTGSSHHNEPPPLPFEGRFYSPTPRYCECLDRKVAIQRVSWTPYNPVRRFTICRNRYTNPNDRCELYKWNDPPLSDFQKSTVLQLKDKVASLVDQISSLEAQAALMEELLQQKDAILTNLQAIVAEKPEEEKAKKIAASPFH